MTRRSSAAPRRLGAALGAMGVVAAVLAGCTSAPMPKPASPSPTSTPSGDGVLRIGTLLPSTGSIAFLGAAPLAGVRAAVREINAAGGVLGHPVEIVSADSGDASTQTAEASFASLVKQGADVVIGPASSVLASRLIPLATEARVALISPAATYPQLTSDDAAGWFFRTVPDYGRQGAPLGVALAASAPHVALVVADDPVSGSIVAPLTESLDAAGGDLVADVVVATSSDSAKVVAQVTEAKPDAVVLATPDNGTQTQALITALAAAGFGGSKLWLTSQNLADYSQAFPGGLLTGVNGILDGATPDAAFIAAVRNEDPSLADPRYAAEAYDATMLAALATVLAGDDGGASIASRIGAASVDGVKCVTFAECLSVLQTDDDVDYDGVTGADNLDAAGDRLTAPYGLYRYGSGNTFSLLTTVLG